MEDGQYVGGPTLWPDPLGRRVVAEGPRGHHTPETRRHQVYKIFEIRKQKRQILTDWGQKEIDFVFKRRLSFLLRPGHN